MKKQDELYKVDHDKMALDAAKTLKEYCNKHDCTACIFYGQMHNVNKECKLGYRSLYGEVAPPERWEV